MLRQYRPSLLPSTLSLFGGLPREVSLRSSYCTILINVRRILLATLKFLAQQPCPLCHIMKDQIPEMGSKLDERRRENLRQDDESRQAKISLTRGWLFERGFGLASDHFKRMLDSESLVLVTVRFCLSIQFELSRSLRYIFLTEFILSLFERRLQSIWVVRAGCSPRI